MSVLSTQLHSIPVWQTPTWIVNAMDDILGGICYEEDSVKNWQKGKGFPRVSSDFSSQKGAIIPVTLNLWNCSLHMKSLTFFIVEELAFSTTHPILSWLSTIWFHNKASNSLQLIQSHSCSQTIQPWLRQIEFGGLKKKWILRLAKAKLKKE